MACIRTERGYYGFNSSYHGFAAKVARSPYLVTFDGGDFIDLSRVRRKGGPLPCTFAFIRHQNGL